MGEPGPERPFPMERFADVLVNDARPAGGSAVIGFPGRAARSRPAHLHRRADRRGVDTRCLEFRTVADQVAALRTDVTRLRFPTQRPEVVVGGAMSHVESDPLERVDA